MLMSQILLKLGTKVGCVKILTLTKNYVTILNSLGVTGTPLQNDKFCSFLHNELANFGWAVRAEEKIA